MGGGGHGGGHGGHGGGRRAFGWGGAWGPYSDADAWSPYLVPIPWPYAVPVHGVVADPSVPPGLCLVYVLSHTSPTDPGTRVMSTTAPVWLSDWLVSLFRYYFPPPYSVMVVCS